VGSTRFVTVARQFYRSDRHCCKAYIERRVGRSKREIWGNGKELERGESMKALRPFVGGGQGGGVA